jgi:hypothetical protein
VLDGLAPLVPDLEGHRIMYAYPQTAPAVQQPGRSNNGIDVASWALVALIVAILCAVVGWFIASHGVLGRGDVQTQAQLAAREGAARGVQDGYGQGAAQGRRQAALRAQLNLAQTKRSAAQDGYSAGFNAGRERAAARAGESMFGAGMSTYGAYPPQDSTDLMASGLFDDEPGFASSAYDEFGYGTSTGSAYDSTSPLSSAALTPGF